MDCSISLYHYNSVMDCSISLKFGTEFDHVTADILQVVMVTGDTDDTSCHGDRVKRQGHMVSAQ